MARLMVSILLGAVIELPFGTNVISARGTLSTRAAQRSRPLRVTRSPSALKRVLNVTEVAA